MIFCGIFDGHGPWGHYVAKQVRNSMPVSLLCNWQETQSQTTLAEPETDLDESDKKLQRFAIWKHLYLKTCADVDQELEHHRKIDSFNSGTTALTVVRQVKRPSRLLPHEENLVKRLLCSLTNVLEWFLSTGWIYLYSKRRWFACGIGHGFRWRKLGRGSAYRRFQTKSTPLVS